MDPIEGEWAPSGGSQRGPEPPAGPIPAFPFRREIENPIDLLPLGAVEKPVLPSLSILLPALNEELGLAEVLKRIPQATLHQRGLAYSIYLLDGHSTDQTRAVATRFGAEVFVQSGRGKGAAFREFVPKIQEDFALFMDPDGTYPPEAIPDLVGVLGSDTPVVLGSRFLGKIDEGAMTSTNYLGNRLLSWFASFLFATPISDVCSGMWAFVSERLKSLGLTADGFDLEADIFAECALRKIPIVQVPIEYHQRLGEPKLHLKEGFRIALVLLKKRLRASTAVPRDESTPEATSAGPAGS